MHFKTNVLVEPAGDDFLQDFRHPNVMICPCRTHVLLCETPRQKTGWQSHTKKEPPNSWPGIVDGFAVLGWSQTTDQCIMAQQSWKQFLSEKHKSRSTPAAMGLLSRAALERTSTERTSHTHSCRSPSPRSWACSCDNSTAMATGSRLLIF